MSLSREERNVLKDFVFIEQAGIIFCKPCKHGIENLSSFRSHLKVSKHVNAKNVKISAKAIRTELLCGTKWENIRDNISALPPSLGGSTFTADQLRYHKAHENTSVRLLRIEGLPIKFGFVCSECSSFCCKMESELREHLIVTHSYFNSFAEDAVKRMSRVPMQSLRQGIWEKLFPVIAPTMGELIEANEDTVTAAEASVSPGGITNRFVSARCDITGPAATKSNDVNIVGNRLELLDHEIESDPLLCLDSELDNILTTRNELFSSEIIPISDSDNFLLDPFEKAIEESAPEFNSLDRRSILNEEQGGVAVANPSSTVKPVTEQGLPFEAAAQTTTDCAHLAKETEEEQLRVSNSSDVPETFFQAALTSVLRSVDSKGTRPEDVVGFDAEKDYQDVPLHALAVDMKKGVNKMLKYNDFTGILERNGFPYLGSVVTALCYLPDRMAASIRRIGESIPSTIEQILTASHEGIKGPLGAKRYSLGKANSPLVHFLGQVRPRDPLRYLEEDGHSAFSISSIEKQIQFNVKSYLRSAGVTTNAAPNFIRSMVIAHNGVFHTVGSRGSLAYSKARSGRRVDPGAIGSENTADGVVPVSKVNFFKVVTTDGSITKYGNEITRLILMIIRVFLVRNYLSQPGSRQIEEKLLSELADVDELAETMGKLPSLLQRSSVVNAVITCLCSVGYCLHEQCKSCPSYDRSDSGRIGLEKGITNDMMSASPCFCKKNEEGKSRPQSLQPSIPHSEDGKNDLTSDILKDKAGNAVNSPHATSRHSKNAIVKSTLPHSVADFSVGDIGVHWLLRALLLYESSERNSTESMMIPKFMSFLSVADPSDDVKKRRFREAHELTGTTAALAYGMKCCGVVEMCRGAKDWGQYICLINEKSGNRVSVADPQGDEEVKKNLEASDAFGPNSALKSFLSLPMNSTNSNLAVQPSPDFSPNVPEDWLLSHQQVSRCFSTSHNTVAAYLVGVHNSLRECAKANEDVRVRFVECKRPEHGVGTCALVDGKECSLETIKKAARTWHSKARNLISERLLLGMKPMEGFESMTELLRDDFRESGRGKSFLSMNENSAFVTDGSSAVLKHIWNNKTLRHEFFGKSVFKKLRRMEKEAFKKSKHSHGRSSSSRTPGNLKSLEMREERLQKYLDDCQELQKLLLACLHVTGGGTARATEQGYLLRNSAEARRNVFVSQGEVIFVARYNKTEGMKSHGNVIARFPDAETSRLFLKYMILIRPIEEFFVRYLHGEEAAEKHSQSFFADIGEQFSDEKCRVEIVKLFAETGIPFSFLQYRHYQIGIARLLMSSEILKMMEEDLIIFHGANEISEHPVAGLIPESPFVTSEADNTAQGKEFRFVQVPDLLGIYPVHQQAGHTLQTADQVYGLSSGDMSGIGHTKLEAFRRTSRAWHRVLGLVEKVEKNPKDDVIEAGLEQKRKRSYCEVAGTSGEGDRIKKALRTGKSDSRMDVQFGCNPPEVIGLHPNPNAALVESARDASTKRKATTVPSFPIMTPTVKIAKESQKLRAAGHIHENDSLPVHLESDRISQLLGYLRRMKGDTKATFKSMEQLYTVQLMLQRQTDMFVILPTGHGKTDMLLLVAFIEQTRLEKHGIGTTPLLSVIVVPLVALSKDLLRRCEEAGIRAGTWSQNRQNVDSLSVMIVSVEQVERKEFATMISEQANKGRLARIEMEECQTTGNWIDFRPSYASLKGNLRPLGIPVQIVLVSATVPPHQTVELAEKHGVTQFHEIRVPTVRQNLSYNVQPVDTPMFKKVEEHICQESVRTLQDHLSHWMSHGNSQTYAGHSTRTQECEEGITKGQIILYCPTLRMRRLLSDMLSEFEFSSADISVLSYDSSLSNSEKGAVMEEWTAFQSRANTTRLRPSMEERQEDGSVAGRRCSDVINFDTDVVNGESTGRSTDSFARSTFQIIVATCGFGMGIDSPYVRSVIHVGFSRSLVEYVQESGRAGRDGNPAKCVILYSRKLVEREMRIITSCPSDELEMMRLDASTKSNVDLTKRKRRETELAAFVQWVQSKLSCRRSSLFSYMDRTTAAICLFNPTLPMTIVRESLCDFCENLEKNSHPHPDGKNTQLRSSFLGEQPAATNVHRDDPISRSVINISPDCDEFPTRTTLSGEKSALDKSQAEKHLNTFKKACTELTRFCLVCLMTAGIRKKLEDCNNSSCHDWRCFKCLQSSHSVKTCELIPFRPANPALRRFAPQEHERRNHCFACGLDRWMRIRMHTREQFSKVSTCPYVNAFRLAALAWDIKKWRSLIIDHFELNGIECLDQSKPGAQDVAFFKWLRELNARNQDRLRLMEVMEFILRRYAGLW